MPPIERQSLNQTAVVWDFDSYGADGALQVSAAREIDVRWEATLLSANRPLGGGDPRTVTAFVGEEIITGSLMWLGKLADLPATPSGLYVVRTYEGVPDEKGRLVQRTVTLSWYGETLPTII